MKKQGILENQVNSIYIGIGSNLGNRIFNIEKAKSILIENQIKILKSSNFYESLSWPNIKDPKFLNIVLEVNTLLSPTKLLQKCKEIEIALGRKKTSRNSPRTCDLDIIDFKSFKSTDKPCLPHPRMHLRNFVLLPLFELNKDWIHPILKEHIKTLILSLSNRDIRSIKQF